MFISAAYLASLCEVSAQKRKPGGEDEMKPSGRLMVSLCVSVGGSRVGGGGGHGGAVCRAAAARRLQGALQGPHQVGEHLLSRRSSWSTEHSRGGFQTGETMKEPSEPAEAVSVQRLKQTNPQTGQKMFFWIKTSSWPPAVKKYFLNFILFYRI